jgi:hypothetical protein
VVQTTLDGAATPFPHQAPSNAPAGLCPTNAPATPDWPPAPPSAVPTIFSFGLPANTTVSLTPNVSPILLTATTLYPLIQQTYTLMATAGGKCTSNCSCKQNFTVTSKGWTSSGSNCCAMGTGGSTSQIGIGGAPYACAGP